MLREVDRKLLKVHKKKTHISQVNRRLQSEESLGPVGPIHTKFDESDDLHGLKAGSKIIEEDEDHYDFCYAKNLSKDIETDTAAV
mmetsp:Transcript_37941/g.58007  ORF Transcript_37941/g.58007 Transcript_37941/m.58007 type:complete len:85 (+) Transcript_37941:2560-2814(+)